LLTLPFPDCDGEVITRLCGGDHYVVMMVRSLGYDGVVVTSVIKCRRKTVTHYPTAHLEAIYQQQLWESFCVHHNRLSSNRQSTTMAGFRIHNWQDLVKNVQTAVLHGYEIKMVATS